ncbi:hypothetical protein M378DRAFT_166375, partial [Amanita muscaria Koide BX008]
MLKCRSLKPSGSWFTGYRITDLRLQPDVKQLNIRQRRAYLQMSGMHLVHPPRFCRTKKKQIIAKFT